MKIFNVVLGTILGVSTLGTVPAIAGTMDCSRTSTNWMFCSQDNGDFRPDVLTLTSPDGSDRTRLTVICTGGGGNRWESYGNFSKQENQDVVSHWCEDYNPSF